MASKNRSEILLVGTKSELESKLCAELRARPYGVTTASCGARGLAKILQLKIDVVVCENSMPDISGQEFLTRVRAVKPRLPVILLDGQDSRLGHREISGVAECEFLPKPFELSQLLELIRRAVLANQEEFRPLAPGEAEFAQTGLIGTGQAMQEVYNQVKLAAEVPESALILGATGTGKELIARAIHQLSRRARHPFIPINCTAIPDSLFESELFGHEHGAFTGAHGRHVGLFEQGNRGTVLLDEIGDLHLDKQVKLLRFLQEPRVRRLGGRDEIVLDIRVVAATHRNLHEAIGAGTFREDLYYRLSVLTIRPPTLNEHPEDILDLARYFLRGLEKSMSPMSIHREAVEFLEAQSWPGNVRHLKHVICRAALLARNQPIGLAHVQKACDTNGEIANHRRATGERLIELLERASVGEIKRLRAKVLEEKDRSLFICATAFAKGNLTKLAQLLGITRVTAREKLRQFGIRPGQAAKNASIRDRV